MSKLVLSLLLTACAAFAQTARVETPAERRAQELIQFFNSGDRAAYRKYISENFARLLAALRQHRTLAARKMLTALVEEVQQFSAQRQSDDITLIVAKCGNAAAVA